MQTTAQIITIGDELLLGQVVDTNSAWLGSELADAGVRLTTITSVADSVAAIEDALRIALSRSSVVITTGGLGPTKDDITKHTLASFFDVALQRDESVFEHVRAMMNARGVEFNSLNQCQADVPAGFTALRNAVGTAPGLMKQIDGRLLFCLPGVPFEMKELFSKQVLPIIKERFSLRAEQRLTVLVFGIAESELSALIAPWEDSLPHYMSLAYLPNPRGIRLRLSVYDVPNGVDAVGEIKAQFAILRGMIEQYYIGYEPISLEAEIARLLVERGSTLSVAESCTGGAISARCTALAGASKWYRGSVTAYDNSVKTAMLGVDVALIESYGAVSAGVVEAMADGARTRLGSDYAIATSGIAGPDGGSEAKPVGTVWIGVATPDGVHSFCRNFGSPRAVCIERATSAALNALLQQIRL